MATKKKTSTDLPIPAISGVYPIHLALLSSIHVCGERGMDDRPASVDAGHHRDLLIERGLVVRQFERLHLTPTGYAAIGAVAPRPLPRDLQTFCLDVQTWLREADLEHEYRPSHPDHYSDSPRNHPNPNPCLYMAWETSGVSGGSYMSDSNPVAYTTGAVPAELDSLDIVLEHLCPNITFLAYRRLRRTLVKEGTREIQQYYGNSSNLAWRSIQLEDLRTYLQETLGVAV